MGTSIFWLLLELLEQLNRHLGGLLLLGVVVLVVVFHLQLRNRIGALERRIHGLERRDEAAAGPLLPAPHGAPRATPHPVPASTPAPPAPAPTPGGDALAEPSPPAAPVPPPPPPAAPTVTAARPASSRQGLLSRFLAGGNWLVRGGVLLLFLGVGFLLKFAADNALLPVQLRLAGVGLGGAALVGVGLRLLSHRRAYALALQGAGVGLLYLTLYAAFRLYGLIPPGAAFGLMLVVVVAAGWLAVRQDALVLAMLGALGGFAAPILASTGSGSHVLLFGYYGLLNAGVLGLSLLRTWRPLNLLGFIFTFGISALWGARYYNEAHFVSVEPFLILFFLMYLAIAIAYAALRSIRLQDPMDATLVFGTPLVAFALQSQLVEGSRYGLAISAAVLAVVYSAAACLTRRRVGDELAVLKEAFIALAVGFLTLTIALTFDARWTSASWALEGAALIWVGWRQRRMLARLAGTSLQVLAGGAWLWHALGSSSWSEGDWLGTAMLAVSGLAGGAVLARSLAAPDGPAPARDEPALTTFLGLWGLMWWICGGSVEVLHLFHGNARAGAMLLFLGMSALALRYLGHGSRWPLVRTAATLLPVLLLLHLLGRAALLLLDASDPGLQALADTHPLHGLAGIGWPLALLSALMILRLEDGRPAPVLNAMHVLMQWLLAALTAWELAWCFDRWLPPVQSWQWLAWLLAPGIVIAVVVQAVSRAREAGPLWPVTGRRGVYLLAGAGVLVAASAVGVALLSLAHPGVNWPIAYIPGLNPLDLGMAAVMGAWVMWLREGARPPRIRIPFFALAALGVAAFVWLNGVLLRALHFLASVPWQFSAMFDSTLVQASLSVLWALTGLLTMLGASRAALRSVWFAGAGLMVVVVVKLMLVDLASSGTIARIVSFISVGLLLMLVGYLAPVPPRDGEACS